MNILGHFYQMFPALSLHFDFYDHWERLHRYEAFQELLIDVSLLQHSTQHVAVLKAV